MCLFRFCPLCVFRVSLGHFVLVLLAFVVLVLVSSVPVKRLAGKNVSEVIYFVLCET